MAIDRFPAKQSMRHHVRFHTLLLLIDSNLAPMHWTHYFIPFTSNLSESITVLVLLNEAVCNEYVWAVVV